MNIFTQFRFSTVKTIVGLVPTFWKSAGKVAKENNASHFSVFLDEVNSFRKYGASYENYEQFHFWGSTHEYKNSFITWRRNMNIMFKFTNQKVTDLFLNKVVWNKRFKKYIKRDWLYTADSTKEDIEQFLQSHKKVIVKVLDGACGKGVDLYEAKDVLLNKVLLNEIIKGEYLLEEQAINIDEIRQFSPISLNTLRFVTCVDRAGKAHIIATVFRMGNGTSHTDNIVSGGIACPIDLITGKICGDGLNVQGRYFSEHPTAHIKYQDFQIPMWEECCKLAVALAEEEPEARFVGWDIVLTTKGIDVLEGNIPPGEELTELDQKGKWNKIMKMY